MQENAENSINAEKFQVCGKIPLIKKNSMNSKKFKFIMSASYN
jgi:hypothetical protein